jgi:hypothetical protein
LERNKDPSGGCPHKNTRIDFIVFFAFHPSNHERTGANMDRTNSKTDTPATRESSRGVLEQTRRDLIVMCQSQGADSSAGHHGFNSVELLQNDVLNGQVWGDHPIQQPSRLLKRQADGLQRALAAH